MHNDILKGQKKMLALEELLQTRAIYETGYPHVLFHGTPEKFDQVDIDKSRDKTDFGKGFYLTTILEQAVEWAGMKRLVDTDFIDYSLIPLTYVLKFELSLDKLKDFKIKIYEDYTEEWLETIHECRTKGRKITEENDITIGPMADNGIISILHEYEKGRIGKEETLNLLKFEKPNIQIAFHTKKSLEAIKFINKTLELQ